MEGVKSTINNENKNLDLIKLYQFSGDFVLGESATFPYHLSDLFYSLKMSLPAGRKCGSPDGLHLSLESLGCNYLVAVIDRTPEINVVAMVTTCWHLVKTMFFQLVIDPNIFLMQWVIKLLELGSIVPIALQDTFGHFLKIIREAQA